ncbi:Protein of unknown function [Gryllus bimaculatus]|nr:Protein of unknown function [Gryllus bimaculatus]
MTDQTVNSESKNPLRVAWQLMVQQRIHKSVPETCTTFRSKSTFDEASGNTKRVSTSAPNHLGDHTGSQQRRAAVAHVARGCPERGAATMCARGRHVCGAERQPGGERLRCVFCGRAAPKSD